MRRDFLKIVYIAHPDLLSTKSVSLTIDRGTSSVKITIYPVWFSNDLIQWNLYWADTFGTYPSVRLREGVRLIEILKIVQCLLTIKIQRLLCTVIKFHVVKEAVLYFLQDLKVNFDSGWQSYSQILV